MADYCAFGGQLAKFMHLHLKLLGAVNTHTPQQLPSIARATPCPPPGSC